MIEFTCRCGKAFRAKPENAGRTGICVSCQRRFLIPPPGEPLRYLDQPSEPEPPAPEPAAPETKATEAKARPFWLDPIVVFGWGTPLLALIAFACYIVIA